MAEERTITVPDLIKKVDIVASIARVLSEKYLLLEQKELESKITDMVSTLNGIRMDLPLIQGEIGKRDSRIKELEASFEFKDNLVCKGDAYYEKNESGKAHGDAHCVKCWENQRRKRKLVIKPDNPEMKVCSNCGHLYAKSETENLKLKKRNPFLKFLDWLKRKYRVNSTS